MVPSIFEEVLSQPFNRLLEQAKDSGARLIGTTCSYIPEALLSVDGLVPVRLRAPGLSGTPMADTYLSSVTCSYTRGLLEFALDGTYDFLDGWVFAASCDHLRRLCDNLLYLKRPPFHAIVDLPHRASEEALGWYEEELGRLAADLGSHFGVDTGRAELAAAIRRLNGHLGRLRRIGELRRRDAPPLTGTDFHKILVACAAAPRDLLAEPLESLAVSLAGEAGIRDYRARILIVGSQLDDPGYIRIVESMGAIVVADRFCLGSIPGLDPIPESDNPLRSLAEYSLSKISCPRMMEAFDQRFEAVLRAASEYRADGVVVQTMKFCDTWGVDSSPLVRALRREGIPVLRLEREYMLMGEGQLRTRVQAFLESMGK